MGRRIRLRIDTERKAEGRRFDQPLTAIAHLQKIAPHLRKCGEAPFCSPAGYGCARPTAADCAQYVPKLVVVIVAARVVLGLT
jgi:hypothetical protein